MTNPFLPETDDYRGLFLRDTPFIDVRAPIEFAAGAFPTARNHPLIDDLERHQIGIVYKNAGQDAAITLGEALVSGERRLQRIAAWQNFLKLHPESVLYCFRGGMRSQISQRWLYQATGITCPRVRGGYKAMRRFLIEQLQLLGQQCRPIVIGGRTGVGKTRLLAGCTPHLDLEGLAQHRGSAFGRLPMPQPAQIDFENAIAITLMQRLSVDQPHLVIEDESNNIGARHIPADLYKSMQGAPLVILEADETTRIEITLQEYVHDALAQYRAYHGEAAGLTQWAAYLLDSIDRIRRRLGASKHAQARELLQRAIQRHIRDGSVDAHRNWISYLLREYYDGMYLYQLRQKADRIVYQGNQQEVSQYLQASYGIRVA